MKTRVPDPDGSAGGSRAKRTAGLAASQKTLWLLIAPASSLAIDRQRQGSDSPVWLPAIALAFWYRRVWGRLVVTAP